MAKSVSGKLCPLEAKNMLSCKVDSKANGTETHGQQRMNFLDTALFPVSSLLPSTPISVLTSFSSFPGFRWIKVKLTPQATHKLQQPLSKRVVELLKTLELPVISGLRELSGSISPISRWSCGTNWMPSDLIPFRHTHLCIDSMFSEMHI